MPTVFDRTRMSCRKPRPSRPPRAAGTVIGVASFGSFSGPFQKRDSRPGRGAKPRRPRRRHHREPADSERETCQRSWHSNHGAQRNRSKGTTRSPVAITDHRGHWIPAFAGMTIKSEEQSKARHPHPSPSCRRRLASSKKHGDQPARDPGTQPAAPRSGHGDRGGLFGFLFWAIPEKGLAPRQGGETTAP